jgi:hypothetical protein
MARMVVIVGAPRSGTNMLRDVLCRLNGVATWPCDEINYIWRHGNLRYPSDELPESLARESVKRYVRRQFDWVIRRYDASVVVEKTTANSLRVPFVDAVVPDARYVFIRRDGLDAVGSAIKRWKAPLDIPYLARKARFVPPADLPYYAACYLSSHAYRLVSREKRVAFWGPRLDRMNELLAKHPLDEICALQWQRCVERSAEAFDQMDSSRWIEVGYESFVNQPEEQLHRITAFAGIEASDDQVGAAVTGVRADSVGKGRESLDDEAVERLRDLVGTTLNRFNH